MAFCNNVVHAIFESQVSHRGGEIAAKDGQHQLTYEQLNASSNRLARHLRELGVKEEIPVALVLDRTVEMVIAILAVLKAGGCYVPIDLAYPNERLEFMVKDSAAPVIITESKLRDRVSALGRQTICIDRDWDRIMSQSADNVESGVDGKNAAYIIYTSGSTGKPKGVVVTHCNVVRLFETTDDWYGFNEQDVWTLFHSFAFDFSVWELWGALLYGGKVVIVPQIVARSADAFYELLSRERVTVLNQTPSAFRQLVWAENTARKAKELSLRYIIFGGEALDIQSLKPWFDRHGDERPQLVNMYGITETTVHVTYRPLKLFDLEAGLGSVIGIPIPDLTLHLLGENREPVRVGTPGEIYVGGPGVARGYLNRPELSRQRFIPNPLTNDPNDRFYRSGDLARYTERGELEYLGRIDDQVKIRGFRIEPGEIEAALNRHPAVRESLVIARQAPAGEKRLVAYLDCRPVPPSPSELRRFAGERLPQYMVPSQFLVVEALPLNVNGKINRQALPAPENLEMEKNSSRLQWGEQERSRSALDFVGPRSPFEEEIAAAWREVMKVGKVSVHENFFESGGHSLVAMQVIARLRERFRIELEVESLFENPTIERFACYLLDEVLKQKKDVAVL